MKFVCWIDWEKNTQNTPNCQFSNLKKFKVKFLFLFFIEAKFTIEVENHSQNMPKWLLFLQYVEDGDKLKSYLFFLPHDFIDL